MPTDPLDECFQILGVQRHATLDEIREAYRDMAKVWHPDRFALDPRMTEKAQAQMARINSAYDRLCQWHGKNDGKPVDDRPASPSPSASPQAERSPWRRNPRPRRVKVYFGFPDPETRSSVEIEVGELNCDQTHKHELLCYRWKHLLISGTRSDELIFVRPGIIAVKIRTLWGTNSSWYQVSDAESVRFDVHWTLLGGYSLKRVT